MTSKLLYCMLSKMKSTRISFLWVTVIIGWTVTVAAGDLTTTVTTPGPRTILTHSEDVNGTATAQLENSHQNYSNFNNYSISNNSSLAMGEEGERPEATTEEPIHLYHMHDAKHKPKRIKFFETQFDHVQTQLTFAFWFFMITIAKIVFQRFENVKGVLPDSALLIVLGMIFGGIFHFVFPDEEIYLQPDWFFLYFLPPIALDAGYFMPNKEFFQNIGAITIYAVVGTLFNTAAIGLTLFGFRSQFAGQPPAIDLLVFATLISAVDPVAVICVFEEVHVNQLLFICVFGESLLNDAVTIVLYHTLNAISEVGTANVIWSDYFLAVVSFLWVSFGGIFVGLLWAILTGIATKWSATVSVVQPLICLLFPYIAYLCAESFGLSGILAIVVCGMLMKQYVIANISNNSKVTVDYFMKTLSSSCEAVIFVFLGLSAVSKNHVFDFTFIIVTLVSCLLYRFIGVVIMTYLLNLKRMQKINFVDQFIMGYGGIRGAVCYGLVMSLSIDIVAGKHMFATTTIIVILFTVFIQGGTIKKLVTYLKVKQHEVYKKSVFEMTAENLLKHATGGMESIVGLHGEYWFRMTIERFNDTYIKSIIMAKKEARGMKIVKHNEEIQVNEAVTYLKQHGSFAGMPTVQSKADLQQPSAVTPSVSVPHFYVGGGGSQSQPQRVHPNTGYCTNCMASGIVQRRCANINGSLRSRGSIPQTQQPRSRFYQTAGGQLSPPYSRQLIPQSHLQLPSSIGVPPPNRQTITGDPSVITSGYDGNNNGTIPRNQSISGFVRDKFAEVNSPGPMYSRHYLHGDAAGRNLFLFGGDALIDDSKGDVVDESENYKTYPYSKSSQKDLLILNIRKASRSNSGAQPPANGPTNVGGNSNGGGGSSSSSGNASLYSSPAREGKPKFMITSDTFDSTSATGDDYVQCMPSAAIYHCGNEITVAAAALPPLPPASTLANSNGNSGNGSASSSSYSIGRFEVGPDPQQSSSSSGSTPTPLRKLSGQRRVGSLVVDEIVCLLLPIEEQDEQHTVHSMRGGSAPLSPPTGAAPTAAAAVAASRQPVVQRKSSG